MIVAEKAAGSYHCCVDRTQTCVGSSCMGWVPKLQVDRETLMSSELQFFDTDLGSCGRVDNDNRKI